MRSSTGSAARLRPGLRAQRQPRIGVAGIERDGLPGELHGHRGGTLRQGSTCLGQQDGGGGIVLARDQLQRGPLVRQFGPDRAGYAGFDRADITGPWPLSAFGKRAARRASFVPWETMDLVEANMKRISAGIAQPVCSIYSVLGG